MSLKKYHRQLNAAVEAAHAAGAVMRKHLKSPKKINSQAQFDIKLELDVRCQKLIEDILHTAFPDIPMLGEEGNKGEVDSGQRWVVDPIDGTVNFAYGIPHACVSVALQEPLPPTKGRNRGSHESVVGVVYDPFQDEIWTAVKGDSTRLNGTKVRVSERSRLDQCIVTVGFGKTQSGMEDSMDTFARVARRVLKVRIMGAAALGLAYLSCGRLDAYVEMGLSLWDIAAGGLLVESAGGEFWKQPVDGEPYKYRVIGSNGLVRKKLQRI